MRPRRVETIRGCVAVLLAALVLAAPAAAAPQQVLYVGDSLGVGTTPLLARELGSSATVHGDSRIGRPSPEGLRVLGQTITPADDIVVFDLGSNDDMAQTRVLASDLAGARRVAGDRCLIVATLNRPAFNGVTIDGLNQTVLAFASAARNVQLVDWNAIAQSQPGVLGPDGVHPTPQGYALRAQLFAQAVAGCSAPAPDQGDSLASPAPAPKVKPKHRKRQIKVPGIESSGISFTEPVRFRGIDGQLLLPNTKPPYPAVVMLGGAPKQAEFLAAHGIAALTYRDRGSVADARAAVTLLAKRGEIRRAGIAVWAFGSASELAARAAAGNEHVAAVAVLSPQALPDADRRDWRARLGADEPAVTTWLRLRSDAGDPAAAWKQVGQPVLAIWGTRDDRMPIRADAESLKAALAAGANRDRTFRWFNATHGGVVAYKDGDPQFAPGLLEETARWLGLRLGERRAAPVIQDRLPPANPGPEARNVTESSVLDGRVVQAIWLLAPALMLLAAARSARIALAALGAGIACAGCIAGGIALALGSDGATWPYTLAFVFAAALAACSIAAARRRAWLAAVACDLWLALALFWLL